MQYIIDYIKKYYPMAKAAGERFGLNPLVILAQLSVESDWGRSYSARVRKNFAGITATSQSKPNEFWSGKSSPSTNAKLNTPLKFRIYDTEQDSFMDFARLISNNYKNAAAASFNVNEYARLISLSRYIDESNGDSRSAYQRGIISRARQILQFGKDIINEKKRSNNDGGVWSRYIVVSSRIDHTVQKKEKVMYIIFLRRLIQAIMSGGAMLPVMVTASVTNTDSYSNIILIGKSLNKILFFCDGIELSSYSGVTLDPVTGTIQFPMRITGALKMFVEISTIGNIPLMVTDVVSNITSYSNTALIGKPLDKILFFCDGVEMSSYTGVVMDSLTGTVDFPIQITGNIKILIY